MATGDQSNSDRAAPERVRGASPSASPRPTFWREARVAPAEQVKKLRQTNKTLLRWVRVLLQAGYLEDARNILRELLPGRAEAIAMAQSEDRTEPVELIASVRSGKIEAARTFLHDLLRVLRHPHPTHGVDLHHHHASFLAEAIARGALGKRVVFREVLPLLRAGGPQTGAWIDAEKCARLTRELQRLAKSTAALRRLGLDAPIPRRGRLPGQDIDLHARRAMRVVGVLQTRLQTKSATTSPVGDAIRQVAAQEGCSYETIRRSLKQLLPEGVQARTYADLLVRCELEVKDPFKWRRLGRKPANKAKPESAAALETLSSFGSKPRKVKARERGALYFHAVHVR